MMVVVVVKILVMMVAMVDMAKAQPRSAEGVICLPSPDIFPCTCKEKTRGPSIACENVDEKKVMRSLSVLKDRSTMIYRLMFRNLDFPRVHDYSFLGLDVQHLTMSRTNISVVETSSLRTLARTLETLDLSYNNLKAVPTAALQHLQNLSFLNLNYNMIKVLGQAVFSGLRALERLSIYDNKMELIEKNAFSGTGDKLYRLNLGKNHLQGVPRLHTLSKLQVLTLSDNQISIIAEGSFRGLEMLDMLMLENNQVRTLEANVFSDLSKLNSVNIKQNIIANISDLAFTGLEENLEWLELGHNRLDHIPSHALSRLHNLRQLDLDSNRIVEVPEDAFEGYGKSIKFLMLNRNNIKTILPMTFFDLHSLEWLKLSHNELTRLSEDTVQPILDTLTMIDVSHNPLECDCEVMWMTVWLREFMRRETYKSVAKHTCNHRNRRTLDIMELSAGYLGCPDNSIRNGGSPVAVMPTIIIIIIIMGLSLLSLQL